MDYLVEPYLKMAVFASIVNTIEDGVLGQKKNRRGTEEGMIKERKNMTFQAANEMLREKQEEEGGGRGDEEG